MQMITTADIVEKNREAVHRGNLAAKAKPEPGADTASACTYVYGEDTKSGYPIGCAIGVVLNKETARAVLDGGLNKGTGVESLIGKVIQVNNPDTQAIASITQALHDCWMVNDAFYRGNYYGSKEKVVKFLQKLQGMKVDEKVFLQWLDLVEQVHLRAD